MNTLQACRDLLQRLDRTLTLPAVAEILLPPREPVPGESDDFGFVVLEDGSVGPFYVSLPGVWRGVSRHREAGMESARLARRMGAPELADSALALGAWNAIGQHLMTRAGFDPLQAGATKATLPEGARIGLVGYFRPLVERLLARGHPVTVIERQPQRVPADAGVDLDTSPAALATCDRVFCTASVLINDTVDEILESCAGRVPVELIGPSASGLPDLLFARGVVAVGGLRITDVERLRQLQEAGESWGAAGSKYQLDPSCWPGVEALLQRL